MSSYLQPVLGQIRVGMPAIKNQISTPLHWGGGGGGGWVGVSPIMLAIGGNAALSKSLLSLLEEG